MFPSNEHPPGCLVITAATNCAPQSASVQRRLKSFRALTVRRLEEKMESDKSGGAVAPDVDVHALALFYSSVLQGMSAQARDGASRAELEAVVDAALRAWPR